MCAALVCAASLFDDAGMNVCLRASDVCRRASTHRPGGLRDLGERLARAHQAVRGLEPLGIDGEHFGTRLHAMLTWASSGKGEGQGGDGVTAGEEGEIAEEAE